MRFFTALLAGAAMFSTVIALTFESVPSSVTVGVPVTIAYSGNGGYAVTINLLHGNDAAALMIIAVLTTTSSSGSFIWTPPSTLVDGPNYAFSIVQYDVTNYSSLFPVTGAGATVSSSAIPSVSEPTSGSMPIPTNGSITAVPYSNTTIPYASAATGSSMARNTTMSMATLTALSTAAGSITGGPRGGDPTETGAAPSVVMSTGGANVLAKSLAFIIGSFAVIVYLI